MLAEAISVIRLLWQGGYQSHRGTYYTVEQARLYTLPEEPPPLMVAADKPEAAKLAGSEQTGSSGRLRIQTWSGSSMPPAEKESPGSAR